MKLFDENIMLDDIALRERTNFRYALLDSNMNYLRELDFLQDSVINDKINTVSELSFTTPTTVDGKSVVEIIRPHYIIEAWSDYTKRYFLVLNTDIKISDKENNINFQVYEYPRQLAKDIVFEYEETSKTLSEVVIELLRESSWKLDYVDPMFDFMYRSFSLKQITLLEALQNIANTYNALILWDSKNKKVSFTNPSRLGTNRGLVLSEEKYLEGIDLSINSEEIITRLYAYGKDNISIESVTLAGSRYLEDYSWFMKPFKMNEEGEVIQSSYYMTDGLCKNLIIYQNTLKENEGKFAEYLEERKEIEKRTKEHWLVLTNLKAQLKLAIDKLDVLNSTQEPDSKIQEAIKEKEKVEKEVNEALEKDNSLMQELIQTQNKIDELHKLLKKENYFTPEQLVELDNFTITKVFQDTSIEDVEDLLKDALENFNTLKKPQLKLSVNLLNFLENKEFQFDWNKLELGDIITIELKDMGIDVYAQIMEIEYSKKDGNIQLVLANEKSNLQDITDDYLQLLYDSKGSSTTINMDKYKWDLAEDANDGVNQILNNAWDSSKQQIQGGVSQSVTISERGLIVRSSEDPQNLLIAQNGVLGLSRDGGNTWRTAITPDGIYAERLVGRVIMGNRLFIEDEEGIIKIEGSKQTIFDPDGNEKVILGRYDDNTYGIKINQGALEIVGGLTDEDLSPSLIEDLKDDSKIRADLRLESPLPNHLTLDKTGITAKATQGDDRYAKLDYRGLYVHGGALDIRTNGDKTQEGVTINGDGIRGYNEQGAQTFYLDSKGNVKIEIVDNLRTEFTIESGKIRTEISNVNQELSDSINAVQSSVTQTEKDITLEVSKQVGRLDQRIDTTNSQIELTANDIALSVNKEIKRVDGRIDTTNSTITQTASSIRSEIKALEGDMTVGFSEVNQTVDGVNIRVNGLSKEINSVSGELDRLDTRVSIQAGQISSKVSRGDVISEINQSPERISIRADRIEMTGIVEVARELNIGSRGSSGEKILSFNKDRAWLDTFLGSSVLSVHTPGGRTEFADPASFSDIVSFNRTARFYSTVDITSGLNVYNQTAGQTGKVCTGPREMWVGFTNGRLRMSDGNTTYYFTPD